MLMVRNRWNMIVEMEQSIPTNQISNRSLINDMILTDREISYYINNMFITETYGKNTEVISSVGQKEKVNITVTGQIKSDYISNDFRLLRYGNELYNTGVREFNLKNSTLNITYYNIRVRSDYDYEDRSHTRKLYIDTTHPVYKLLRPILINHELIDVHDNGNIKLRPNDIKSNLNGEIILKGIEKTDYHGSACKVKHQTYQVKCKKGDTNGE